VTAYHVRLQEAQSMCAAAQVSQPSSPTDPQVVPAAEKLLRGLGWTPDNFSPWWGE
jgi:hypothetical protein